ncbi:hypothetical protein V2A60_006848 [Cordyceps javanica]
MVRYSTLAVAGLVTYTASASVSASTAAEANTVGTGVLFHIPDRSRSSQPLTARHAAAAAAQCFAGQVACDASCIDGGFECCHVGQGQACQEGYSCYDQGCCRHGQTCSGPPRGCTATTKMCDIGCITRDRVCCNLGDGSSCDAGTVCLAVGLCGRPKSEAGPRSDPASASSQTSESAPGPSVVVGGAGGSSSTGSTGGGGGGGSAATPLETLSDTVIDASVSSSAAMSSSGGNSPSPATTTPASESSVPSGAPLPDKTKPSGSAGSSPTSAERGGAGETLKAPAVLAGLLVAAAYII